MWPARTHLRWGTSRAGWRSEQHLLREDCAGEEEKTKTRNFVESWRQRPLAFSNVCKMHPLQAGLASKKHMHEASPAWTTQSVCSDVPDAILVNVQAASNCKVYHSLRIRHIALAYSQQWMVWSASLTGLSCRWSNSTKRGTIPAWMTCWMGGFFSDNNKRTNTITIPNNIPKTYEVRYCKYTHW